MKKLFQQLGFTADDLAILLFISVQTIYSWMRRNATIPWKYQVYLNALESCVSQVNKPQLAQLATSIQKEPEADFIAQKNQTLQILQNEIDQLRLKQEQFYQKQESLLTKVRIAQTFNDYLPQSYQQKLQVTNWQNAMLDKYRWQYHKLYFEQQLPLEERLTSLEAKLAFWKEQLIES